MLHVTSLNDTVIIIFLSLEFSGKRKQNKNKKTTFVRTKTGNDFFSHNIERYDQESERESRELPFLKNQLQHGKHNNMTKDSDWGGKKQGILG